jgi:hypothetical protein
MDELSSDYSSELLDYSLETAYTLKQTTDALNSSASPGGMEFAAITALLTTGAYLSWKRSRDWREDLEEKYLGD